MVYARPFHRLVVMGSLYSDTFNVTLSIGSLLPAQMLEVTPALLIQVANHVDTWWNDPLSSGSTGGLSLAADAKLTGIKLNRIDVDGKYMDSETYEHTYPTPIAGSGPAGAVPQLSIVTSLYSAHPRTTGGKGRMYWPPSQLTATALGADGRISAAGAAQYAQGSAQFIRTINAAYSAQSVPALACIASKVGAGVFQGIEEVGVGRVVDTMRSRRNKLDEDKVFSTV